MTVAKLRKVMVGKYTYETDLKLKVGDKVLLPTPSFLRDVQGPTCEGSVTSLESTYEGPCVRVIRRLPAKEKA